MQSNNQYSAATPNLSLEGMTLHVADVERSLAFYRKPSRKPPSFKRGMNGRSLFGVGGDTLGHPMPGRHRQRV